MPSSPVFLADPVSPPVHLHQLLTSWQFGDWTADAAFALTVAAGIAYLWGARTLAARSRRWPRHRAVAFLAGLVMLVIAIVSGVASYDDSVFTVHVIQHLIIMMIAPPLLALGAPVTLALQASPRAVQTRIARFLHLRTVRTVTSPIVVAALYYCVMWIDMQTSFYPYSLERPLVHDASHGVMLLIGCLFWWPLVAVDELPHRPVAPVRLGLLFVGIPFEAFLGISIMSMGSPIARQHTLSDTHTGGAVFWVSAMAIMLGASIVISLQWMRQEERRATRADNRPSWNATDDNDRWTEAWMARAGAVPSVSPPGPDRDQALAQAPPDGQSPPGT